MLTPDRSPAQGCGECSACCFLLSIDEPLNKPYGQWCPHCRPGQGGCSIYDSRPEACRSFSCYWLRSQNRPGQEMAPELRPDRCGVMFMGSSDAGPREVFVHVLPHRPAAWRKPAIRAKIDDLLRRGGTVTIIVGQRRKILRAGQPVFDITDGAP